MMLFFGILFLIGGIGNAVKALNGSINQKPMPFFVMTVIGAALFIGGLSSSGSSAPSGTSVQGSKTHHLSKFRIGNFRWEKGGFGAVMVATFAIYNDNEFAVKDVEVTCVHSTPGGTLIDRNTRTA